MKRIVVDLESFLFKQFVDISLQFIRNNFNIEGHPSQGVMWVEHEDNTAYFNEKPNRDFKSELFDERKRLFFPFSLPNFGEPISCADGEEYFLDDDILYPDDLEEDEEAPTGFEMDTNNILGFILEIDNNKFIINSAKYTAAGALTGETIVTEDFCGVLDLPMSEFIQQFIRK